jgi:hypothetical protein
MRKKTQVIPGSFFIFFFKNTMTIRNLPLNKFANNALNIITNESKVIGDPYSNVIFAHSFTATVPTQSGNQSVTLSYVRNSKRVTASGNYVAIYNYTLDLGVSYTYVYLAFKPINNKLFMWKYLHADSGVGVLSYESASTISQTSYNVRQAHYRLIKQIDTLPISANPNSPLLNEIFEVEFKSQCVTINGTLENPPIKKATNNVMCFAQGPAFLSSVVCYYTDAQGVSGKLIEGLDYYAGYQFLLATEYTKAQTVGALVFDHSLNGVVTCKYSALGGNFGITDAHIAAMNLVVGEPVDLNYESAIRDAITTPLILDTWPNTTNESYIDSIHSQLIAKSVDVTVLSSALT